MADDLTNEQIETAKAAAVAKGVALARKAGTWTQEDTDALNALLNEVNAYEARQFFLNSYDQGAT